MPNYYAELDGDGKVFAVSELAGVVDSPLMIPITFEQYQDRRLLFTRFVEGKFKEPLRGSKRINPPLRQQVKIPCLPRSS